MDGYTNRILRGTGSDGFHSTKKLGAIGADLGAVARFFDTPWTAVSPNLAPAVQAWLLNAAAFRLRALAQLTEAAEPMRVSMEIGIDREQWAGAAISSSNLSELELTRGSVTAGGESVTPSRNCQEASGLKPRTYTCHLKDWNLLRAEDGLVVRGYALGDGVVDLKAVVELLRTRAPHGRPLHVNIETPKEYIPLKLFTAGF